MSANLRRLLKNTFKTPLRVSVSIPDLFLWQRYTKLEYFQIRWLKYELEFLMEMPTIFL